MKLFYGILILFAFFFTMNYIPLLYGYISSNNKCLSRPKRIEMFFPGYKLGCWLVSEKGSDYYWSEK